MQHSSVVTDKATSIDEVLSLLDMELWTGPRETITGSSGNREWPKNGIFHVQLAGIRPHQLGELVEAIREKYDHPGRTILPLKEVQIGFADGEIQLVLDKSRAAEMLPWPEPPDD